MRIVDIRERPVSISRYADPNEPSGGLTTSVVALHTDVVVNGAPVVGYGFSSIGRFAQSGLIRERFGPRLLKAGPAELCGDEGRMLDPFRAWKVMMKGEKPGGHGERCVAVGTLDMAIWDAVAKIEGLPLHRSIARALGLGPPPDSVRVPVYAGGGYYYRHDDIARLSDEIRRFQSLGFTRFKIKIGGAPLVRDCERIEAVLGLLRDEQTLAVDAMNAYDFQASIAAADALAQYGLRWFEDVCDPLDFETQSEIARRYPNPIAAGEALFSRAEAALLLRHGGLRSDRDILLFDPVHCYGLPGYFEIVAAFDAAGWPRSAFWPHGGHPFTLHVAATLGLGGAEVNPAGFAPFGGLCDDLTLESGSVQLSDTPGIGFERKSALHETFDLPSSDSLRLGNGYQAGK